MTLADTLDRNDYRERLSGYLRRKLQFQRNPDEWLARRLMNCSPRTAKAIRLGERHPRWDHFLDLYRIYGPEILDEVLGGVAADRAQHVYAARLLRELIEEAQGNGN